MIDLVYVVVSVIELLLLPKLCLQVSEAVIQFMK
jgi:hypothetical protein